MVHTYFLDSNMQYCTQLNSVINQHDLCNKRDGTVTYAFHSSKNEKKIRKRKVLPKWLTGLPISTFKIQLLIGYRFPDTEFKLNVW